MPSEALATDDTILLRAVRPGADEGLRTGVADGPREALGQLDREIERLSEFQGRAATAHGWLLDCH